MIVVSTVNHLQGENPLFVNRHGAELRRISISQYHITPSDVQQRGEYLQMRINAIRDKAKLYQWLEWMGIQALTVEQSDIPILVPSKVVAAGLTSNWTVVGPMLSELRPDELFDSLEQAALRIMSARPIDAENEDTRYIRERQIAATDEMLRKAGIDTDDPWNTAADRARAEESQRLAALADKYYEQFREENEPQPDPHPYRETTGF